LPPLSFDPEFDELPPLSLVPEPELPDPPLPEPELELPDPLLLPWVDATEEPLPLCTEVPFPTPDPGLLLEPDILDKSENIGLSLLVIPYAATAAAIHNTIIMEIIIFSFSKFIPP
jgi:hypothetical protein